MVNRCICRFCDALSFIGKINFIMNKFDLNNRTAVITGGAQGFGFDIAKKFLNSGANVIIWDIDEKALQSAV